MLLRGVAADQPTCQLGMGTATAHATPPPRATDQQEPCLLTLASVASHKPAWRPKLSSLLTPVIPPPSKEQR